MLMDCRMDAQRVLRDSKMPHVIYGLKIYNDHDELSTIQLYTLAMSEEEFNKTAARCRNSIVYALHRR